MFSKSFLCLLAMGCAALGTCGCRKTESPLQVKLPTVTAVAAHMEAAQEGTNYSVSLIPNRQADLEFKSSGIVDEIRMVRGADGRMRELTMGDVVTSGEAMAHVRMRDYENSLDEAQAQLHDVMERRNNAMATLVQAQNDYERATHLYQSQSMTKQDFDRAQQEIDSAKASMHQVEADIVNSKAAVAQAELALSDTAVVAPFSGVVVARQVELGNLVSNSTVAFTVEDISLLKADFTVSDTVLPTIELGRKIRIRLLDGEREIESRVTAVSPSADSQSRVFTVELTVPNPKADLKPGMIGSIDLEPAQQSQAHITVPLSSLVQSDPDHGFALFVLDNAQVPHVHLRPVQLGANVGGKVQVLSGLNVGERVIAFGAQNLHDNDAVRVSE
jgi:RND family efflux transporter MFP subunit